MDRRGPHLREVVAIYVPFRVKKMLHGVCAPKKENKLHKTTAVNHSHLSFSSTTNFLIDRPTRSSCSDDSTSCEFCPSIFRISAQR